MFAKTMTKTKNPWLGLIIPKRRVGQNAVQNILFSIKTVYNWNNRMIEVSSGKKKLRKTSAEDSIRRMSCFSTHPFNEAQRAWFTPKKRESTSSSARIAIRSSNYAGKSACIGARRGENRERNSVQRFRQRVYKAAAELSSLRLGN